MTVQLHARRLLQLDNYLLIFACVCLTGATVVLNWGISALYQINQLPTDPARAELPTYQNALIVLFQRILHAYVPLHMATIFAAKFSYLCFFKHLVDRTRPFLIYWRFVVTATAMVAILCILQMAIVCPYISSQACEWSTYLADSPRTLTYVGSPM